MTCCIGVASYCKNRGLLGKSEPGDPRQLCGITQRNHTRSPTRVLCLPNSTCYSTQVLLLHITSRSIPPDRPLSPKFCHTVIPPPTVAWGDGDQFTLFGTNQSTRRSIELDIYRYCRLPRGFRTTYSPHCHKAPMPLAAHSRIYRKIAMWPSSSSRLPMKPRIDLEP